MVRTLGILRTWKVTFQENFRRSYMMLSAKEIAPGVFGRHWRGYRSEENWIQSGNPSSPTVLSSGSHPTRVRDIQADRDTPYCIHHKHTKGNPIATNEQVHFK